MKELLKQLAEELRNKNLVDDRIAKITGRPCERGHTGEYIASLIFGITLEAAANAKYYDGKFAEGALAGKTVEIKWYGKLEYMLDIKTTQPDYYLVMTGNQSPPVASKGKTRPWTINHIFIFDADDLMRKLKSQIKRNGDGIKIGIATPVRKHLWEEAEMYPKPRSPMLIPNADQRELLARFG
jgi:hypothetical protein